MGTLGTSVKLQIERVINQSRISDNITITPVTRSGGSYGGYNPSESDGTATTVKAIPTNSFSDPRVNFQPFGDLGETEVALLVKESVTVDSNDMVTWESEDYDITEIQKVMFNGVVIAKALKISLRK